MKILLLWGFLLCMPALLGQGILSLSDEFTHRKSSFPTRYSTGVIIMLFSAGPVNAYGVLRDIPLSKLIWIWGVLLLSFATLCYLATVVQKIMAFRSSADPAPTPGKKTFIPRAAILLFLLAGLMILGQFLYVLLSGHVNLSYDITPETVNSFLQTGSLYRVNPLTGSPYTEGVPNRLRLMCLPTFYAMLCRVFGLPMETVVCRIIPAYILLCGYLAYLLLANVLFPGNDPRTLVHRALFFFFVALLVFATDSGLGVDGFDLLHGGYRETTIRLWILIPALIAFVLERRWVLCLLILATEAVTIWTVFGTGACLVITLGLILCRCFLETKGRKEAVQ